MGFLKKCAIIISVLVVLGYVWTSATVAQNGPELLMVDLEGPVTPFMQRLIERSIKQADIENVEALIIRLDTPGGRVDTTVEIIKAIIGSEVPVIIYVWPPGGMAGSAGTFITLAGHVAVMAPNTTIGAASPVTGSGEDVDETMRAKLENILTAEVRNLTERRGRRALRWAESTVTKAEAATAQEALDIGVIDFISKDVETLLEQLDGYTVEVNGEEETLQTAQARITAIELTSVEEFLGVISIPEIALLLISIGSLAIAYEFINPGGYIGGVIGLICLLTGFYGVGQLPVNYAGMALVLLAFILFGAELFTPTYGVLTALGVASFIIGGLILFDTPEFTYDIPLPSLIGMPLVIAAVFSFGLAKIAQSTRLVPTIGQEAMIGSSGTARTALNPKGTVFVWGELWQATSEDGLPIEADDPIIVTEMDGLRLTVKGKTKPSKPTV